MMCPVVRAVSEPSDVVRVSLDGLTALEITALPDLLPELKDELALRWPVKNITLTRPTRRRNPFHPNQIEIVLVIALTTGFMTKLGEKLSTEAFDWIRDRLKRKHTVKKKRKPKT